MWMGVCCLVLFPLYFTFQRLESYCSRKNSHHRKLYCYAIRKSFTETEKGPKILFLIFTEANLLELKRNVEKTKDRDSVVLVLITELNMQNKTKTA